MPVRFGLIGCGKIAERLALPQLTGGAAAKVTALVDLNRHAAQRLAWRFKLDPRCVWTDWRRMLREADVDAVGVCVPNDLHRDVAVGCCEAGKHVMVEKPIAPTLQEADQIITAARAAGVLLMVEQTQRFDPIHETAKTVLDSGRLGRILMVRGRIGHAGPEYWSRTSRWLTSGRRAGGGALMDVGIHIADLLRWLSGKTVRRVCAVTARLQKSWKLEDNASALLEFSDGTLGSCEASWTTRPYEVATWFYGARGTLTTAHGRRPPLRLRLGRTSGDPNLPKTPDMIPVVPARSRLGGAYPYFAQCILTNRKPFVSGEEGRAALEIVLAAYRSARDGGWVDVLAG